MLAQGIAAATSAAGYASLVAEYGPLIGGPLDPSAAPYAAEGASLADAALAEIQSNDTAWLTQQTTTADADLTEENTEASAQAGLANSQAAADAALTVSSAQADYNGTLASIAAGPSAAAGPTLPAAPAPLTAASIGFAAPSLPAQPMPTPGVPDAWFETLIGTNIESNPAAFHGPSPVTVASDEPSINVQYGQVSEAVNLAAVETSIQAPITATNDYYYFNYAVTPATYAAPTGMTYDAVAPPTGTTGSYDGNAWYDGPDPVDGSWMLGAVANVTSDAAQSHAGGWAGISGAAPAVDLGTSNATLSTLQDDLSSSAILHQVCFAAGTLVLTEDGPKRIETVRDGELVYAVPDDDADAPAALCPVVKAYHNSPQPLLNVHAGDFVIRATKNHPFWVEGQGWTAAGELAIGDRLRSHDGALVAVTDIFDNGDVEPVFNLQVAVRHTYFVASLMGTAVLVHNDSTTSPVIALGSAETAGQNANADGTVSAAFAAKVQAALWALNPQVAAWWQSRSVSGAITVRDANGWTNFFRQNSYGMLTDSNGRPVEVVDDDYTAAQVAVAIVDSALGKDAAFSAAYYAHGVAKSKDPAAALASWRASAFRQAAQESAAFAEIYVQGIAGATTAGDIVVAVDSALENGITWNSVISSLPLLGPLLAKAGGAIIIKIANAAGDATQEIKISQKTLQELASLPAAEQRAITHAASELGDAEKAAAYIEQKVAATTAAANDVAQAATRLGINLSEISIINGVARLKIDLTISFKLGDIRAIEAFVKSRGATQLIVDTGQVITPSVAANIQAAINAGRQFLGGTPHLIREVPSLIPGEPPAKIFEIIFNL